MEFQQKDRYGIEDLKQIMELLRGEEGCPWDRAQTHASIRSNLIEETYEVCEAIDKADAGLLREELGDVLLQVVFHSQMETEKGVFCFDDVANDICEKLIVRHPHIFGDVRADSVEAVLHNWNTIKRQTKGQTTATETLESVPRQLPALMRSAKVQSRAEKANAAYAAAAVVFQELNSGLAELQEAAEAKNRGAVAEKLGGVLFSAVNVARFYDMDAEELLTRSCDKFVSRFAKAEELANQQGMALKDANVAQMDAFWREAKKQTVE